MASNERIRVHIEHFDQKVYELFFGNAQGSSRILRYESQYMRPLNKRKEAEADEGDEFDSEDEEQLAYDMFIDDIAELRQLIIKSMHQVLVGQISLEAKFANEREFFSAEITQAEKTIGELSHRISQLEKDLDYERNYNMKLFVDEEVTQLCQRAFFSFQLLEKEHELVKSKED